MVYNSTRLRATVVSICHNLVIETADCCERTLAEARASAKYGRRGGLRIEMFSGFY